MKIEATLWTGAAAFYVVIAAIYWFLSREPAGTALLAVGVGFGLLAGLWAWSWYRRTGPRPEDVADADMEDDAGVVGTFSAASGWPILVAFGASVTALGAVGGPWLWAPGLALTLWCLIRMATDRPSSGR